MGVNYARLGAVCKVHEKKRTNKQRNREWLELLDRFSRRGVFVPHGVLFTLVGLQPTNVSFRFIRVHPRRYWFRIFNVSFNGTIYHFRDDSNRLRNVATQPTAGDVALPLSRNQTGQPESLSAFFVRGPKIYKEKSRWPLAVLIANRVPRFRRIDAEFVYKYRPGRRKKRTPGTIDFRRSREIVLTRRYETAPRKRRHWLVSRV